MTEKELKGLLNPVISVLFFDRKCLCPSALIVKFQIITSFYVFWGFTLQLISLMISLNSQFIAIPVDEIVLVFKSARRAKP